MDQGTQGGMERVEDGVGRAVFCDGWPERVGCEATGRQAGAAPIAALLEGARREMGTGAAEGLLGRLTLALPGQRLGCLLGDQQAAKRVQIASQDAEGQIALKAKFGSIPAAFQAVTRL